MRRLREARVLHLIDSLDFGGAQTVVKLVMERKREDDGVHLMVLRSTARRLFIDNPNVEICQQTSRFSLHPLFAIARRVKALRITVLHCHLFRSQVFGYLAARLLIGRPVTLVFHEHGSAVQMESGSLLERTAFDWFQHWAAPRVAAYVSISRFVGDRLSAIVGGRIRHAPVIFNPLPPSTGALGADRVAARQRLGLPADAWIVGMAGRIVRRKGWRDFLEAIRLTLRQVPVYFVVAGSGPEYDELVGEAGQSDLRGSGKALGYLENLSDFYAALDVFVMPSHWEPSGLAHLEAQLHGVPVVAYDIPGLNETVHAGVDCLMCPADEPGGLAEAIVRLVLDESLRRRTGAAGKVNAQRFSIENYTRALDDLYAKLGNLMNGCGVQPAAPDGRLE